GCGGGSALRARIRACHDDEERIGFLQTGEVGHRVDLAGVRIQDSLELLPARITHLILLSPTRVALRLTGLRLTGLRWLTVSLLRLTLAVLGLAGLVRVELSGAVRTVGLALAALRLAGLLRIPARLAGLRLTRLSVLTRLLILLRLALPVVGIGLIARLGSTVVLGTVIRAAVVLAARSGSAEVLTVAELRGLRSAGGRLLTIGRGAALSVLVDLRAHPRCGLVAAGAGTERELLRLRDLAVVVPGLRGGRTILIVILRHYASSLSMSSLYCSLSISDST